jgi:GT2 family glycosyltransferase
MQDTSVSVIIVTYNNAADIRMCLDSLTADDFRGCEILVYDNASSDGTPSIVSAAFPQVKLTLSDENVGFAAGNNNAVAEAIGQYLVFLNPDSIVAKGWLEPLLKVLENDGTVGAVTPEIAFADPPVRVNTCGNTIHFSGITYCRRLGEPLSDDEPHEVGAVSGAAFVIRRRLFQELGGFPEGYFMYYEDTDLSLKLRLHGWRCMAVPASKIRHAYEPGFSSRKLFFLERNRYLTMFSRLPGWLLLFMMPSITVMELVSWGYSLTHGRAGLAAKLSSWRAIWERRSWIRQQRKQWVHDDLDGAFLLRGFASRVDAGYIDGRKSWLAKGVGILGWLAAAPFLGLALRFLGRRG